MDPARKRKTRLVVALTCALLLAGALVYTSFSAASEARQPSELADAAPGQTYQLAGRVAKGSWEHQGTTHPFREGREIVIDVRKQGATFEGQPDSLVTKCPSKFTAEPKT